MHGYLPVLLVSLAFATTLPPHHILRLTSSLPGYLAIASSPLLVFSASSPRQTARAQGREPACALRCLLIYFVCSVRGLFDFDIVLHSGPKTQMRQEWGRAGDPQQRRTVRRQTIFVFLFDFRHHLAARSSSKPGRKLRTRGAMRQQETVSLLLVHCPWYNT